MDPVRSCLRAGELGMKRVMLEAVATRAVVSPSDVKRFAASTLLNHASAVRCKRGRQVETECGPCAPHRHPAALCCLAGRSKLHVLTVAFYTQ